jgi:hypothetical protein
VAVDDPRTAWLAAASARWMFENRQGPLPTVFFGLLVISWAVIGVESLVDERWLLGAIFLGFFLWGVWLLYAMRPAAFEKARDAERLNRAVAERAGIGPGSAAARPREYKPLQTAAAAVALWIFYDLSFGALTRAMDGKSLAVDQIVLNGVLFATFMVIFQLTVGRRRNRSRAERSIG